MVDQLAAPADLAVLLGLDPTDADVITRCTLLVQIGTAIVQEAAGNQRLVAVADDEITTMGTTSSWLELPQRPVTDVSEVTLDGVALVAGAAGSGGATYRRVGDRLWRGNGWQTYVNEPSQVVITCDHGYAAGVQDLQLARSAVLGVVRAAWDNAGGATSVRLGDYAVAYAAVAAAMDASEHLRKALVGKYGRPVGLAKVG